MGTFRENNKFGKNNFAISFDKMCIVYKLSVHAEE